MKENFPSEEVQGIQQNASSWASKNRSFKCAVVLIGVLIAVCLPYVNLTRAYFVGYDDFNNLHRAAFEDSETPSRIFSTSHFGSPKYRPLDCLLIFGTYQFGHGSPLAFRARNLICHLLNCALLFALGMLLFNSISISAMGTLLFGLNPLAHQAVAGAVWTNTAAATTILVAVVLGLWSYRFSKHRFAWLLVAALVAWIGIFIYEPDVTALGIVFLYFAVDSLFSRRLHVPKSWVWILLSVYVAVVGSMVIARRIVMPGAHQPAAPVFSIAKEAAMYLVAVLLPVDPLLANQWFGTPLVSQISLTGWVAVALTAVASLAFLLVALTSFLFRRRIPRIVSSSNFVPAVFLLASACFYILPLLVFNDHPSETYLYVPVAFLMLFLASMLGMLRRNHKIAAYGIAAFLLVSFTCATWSRSERVIRSAAIAQRIFSGLPLANWRQGEWYIRLANVPGEAPPRYGLYNYRGLDTIGTGTGSGILAVEHSLQVQTGNEHGVQVDALSAEQLNQACSATRPANEPCFWIYPDGRVEEFQASAPAKPAGTI